MEKNKQEDGNAPFNMALFTLEKIHNILTRIAEVSFGHDEGAELTAGKSQYVKSRLVKQLFVQCIPLINSKDKEEWEKEIWERIQNIKLQRIPIYNNQKLVGHREAYDEEIDNDLDLLTIDIQEKLQNENYFMPPKDDPKHSWKES